MLLELFYALAIMTLLSKVASYDYYSVGDTGSEGDYGDYQSPKLQDNKSSGPEKIASDYITAKNVSRKSQSRFSLLIVFFRGLDTEFSSVSATTEKIPRRVASVFHNGKIRCMRKRLFPIVTQKLQKSLNLRHRRNT
jgi:hypothetical protein